MRGDMPCQLRQTGREARRGFWFALSPVMLSMWLTGCASTGAIKQGETLEDSGKLEAAASTYQQIVSGGGTDADKAAQKLSVVQGRLATLRAREAETAFQDGRLSASLDLAIEAWGLSHEQNDVRDVAATISRSVLGRAETEAQQGNPFEAVSLIERVRKGFPDAPEMQDSVSRTAQKVRTQLGERKNSASERNLPGNALLYQLALRQLDPGDSQVEQTTRTAIQQWQKRMRVPVTTELSGRGISLSQVQTLTQAFASLRFQSPLMSPQLGPRVPEGLHLEISDLDFDIRQSQEPGFGIRAIETGTRRVRNPELQKTREALDKLEADVMATGEKIDALNAAIVQQKGAQERQALSGELQRTERDFHQKSQLYSELQERLAATPAEVDVANFQEVRYPLDLYRRTCLLVSRLKASSTRPDLPLKVDLPVTGKFEQTCQVHPAYLQYGIPAGVLRFDLSDGQMKERAQEALATEVGSTVDRMLNDYMVLERKMARELERDGRKEEALEHWLRTSVGVPGDVPEEVKTALTSRGFTGWDELRVR